MGRAVEHLFEKEDGEKNEWRGMVLSRAPIMTHWYYITYEKDPVLYMYQLWDDYKDGDLRVLPESGTVRCAVCLHETVYCFMIQKLLECGRNRTGLIYIVSITKHSSFYCVSVFFPDRSVQSFSLIS